MIIDDDFLPHGVADQIEQEFLSDNIPWMLNRHLVSADYKFNISNIKTYEGTQFNHILYYGHKQQSDLYDIVLKTMYDFCNKNNITVKAMIRSKANLTFPDSQTNTEETKSPHVDHSYDHLVFLYYINDADGDTVLYNEKFENNDEIFLTEMTRVTPKKGRAICFNGLHYHTPLVPQSGYRAVINVTFLGEINDN